MSPLSVRKLLLFLSGVFMTVAASAQAAPITWVSWTAGTVGETTGFAVGTIPDLGVAVGDSGEFVTPGSLVADPTMVPEPATLLLLGAGLTAIAFGHRRVRRRRGRAAEEASQPVNRSE